jgi:hypothetical protein
VSAAQRPVEACVDAVPVVGVDVDRACCDLCGRADVHEHSAAEYGFAVPASLRDEVCGY